MRIIIAFNEHAGHILGKLDMIILIGRSHHLAVKNLDFICAALIVCIFETVFFSMVRTACSVSAAVVFGMNVVT